jgi:hypothetical protein
MTNLLVPVKIMFLGHFKDEIPHLWPGYGSGTISAYPFKGFVTLPNPEPQHGHRVRNHNHFQVIKYMLPVIVLMKTQKSLLVLV